MNCTDSVYREYFSNIMVTVKKLDTSENIEITIPEVKFINNWINVIKTNYAVFLSLAVT